MQNGMALDPEQPTTDEKTPLREKIACGTGHVMNDLFLQMAISFNVLYFIKVAELDGNQAGMVMFINLLATAVFAPIAGYCGDCVTIPVLSRVLGRRKAWHLIGVIIMTIFYPLLYTYCLVCTGDSSWQRFAYHLTVLILVNGAAFQFMCVNHLAIIAVVAKNETESVELNVLRTMFTYASGALAYGLTWVILDTSGGGDKISPSSWKEFTTTVGILVFIGLVFSVIFHVGTKEPKETKKAVDEYFTKQGLLAVAFAFMMASDVKPGDDNEPVTRKCSFPLRKISSYLGQFDETTTTKYVVRSCGHRNLALVSDENAIQEEKRGEEIEVRDTEVSVEARKISGSSQSSRKASVVRRISTYLVPFNASVLLKEGTEEIREDDETPGTTKPRQRRYATAEGRVPATADSTDTREETRKSSFPQKIVDACHMVENNTDRTPKTRASWLKDPQLYIVSFVYAITVVVVCAGSYFAFYLTDHLEFPKESIAYFPLILLASGLIGTACSKLVAKKLGNRWTYCLAAAVLIGTAVWFFFITKSVAYLTYPAAVMVGVTTSMMFAMSTTYLTDMVGDNKETSGFVCSVAGFVEKFMLAIFYVVIQAFYPSRSENAGECEECAVFARYVYTLSQACPALVSLLLVLFFYKSNRAGTPVATNNSSTKTKPVGPKRSAAGPITLVSYKSSSDAN